MKTLSQGEKDILKDGVYNPFWKILQGIIEEAIQAEAENQLEVEADDYMAIQRYKSRREAMQEILKLPNELSK